MNTKLVEAFRTIHMPQDCIQKIEEDLIRHNKSHSRCRRAYRPVAVSLCLIILLLCFSPTAVRALEAMFCSLSAGTAYVDKSFYYYNDGKHILEGHHKWESVCEAAAASSSASILSASLKEGKLYFTANEEKIDISQQISYEIPFTYIYTDQANITHYIAVGGDYSAETGLKYVGILEFLQYRPEEDTNSETTLSGWMGGYSENYCDSQGTAYPWVTEAFERLQIPFAPPGN